MKPCIVLMGAQHVGKTTLGKGLAEKLGVPFIWMGADAHLQHNGESYIYLVLCAGEEALQWR